MEQNMMTRMEAQAPAIATASGYHGIAVFPAMMRNEWIKQAKRRKMWVFAGIAALVPLALAVLQRLLLPGQSVLTREDVLSSALHLVAPLVLPLMAAALAIDAFCDEAAKGAIRSTLFLPAGRTAVYWAKAIAVLAGCGVLVGAMWGMTLIAGIFLPGRGPVFAWIGADLASGIAALAPAALIVGFVVMLSQWLKSAGGILVTLVLASIAVNFLPFLIKGIGPVLPTTWMGLGASVRTMSMTGALSALVVLVAWTVLFAMVGWLRFEKRPF